MKPLLCLMLLTLVVAAQSQTSTETNLPLVVVKFTCGRYEERSSVIRPVDDPDPPKNEPIRVNRSTANEPQEITNRRDMQERRAELRTAEINAQLSTNQSAPTYFYHLEVKNSGTRGIKSFAWEYQPGESSDPSDRQFYCVINAKPDEKKKFDLYTLLAPTRVIDATIPEPKKDRQQTSRAVINKIEYLDGSVWIRPGWNSATFSVEATQKLAIGKCIGF